MCVCTLSRVLLFITPWAVAHQAPRSMGFCRQEYWSGLPFPTPGDLLNPGVKPESLSSPALAGGLFTTSTTWKSESEGCSVVSNSLRPNGLYSPWDSPGQDTGVGSLSLLQGIFPTQGSNPGLLHCRQILYQLSHKGSPRILEWVAYPFSRKIFPTQELNWGLLHCRWILYQLSYEGNSRAEPPGKRMSNDPHQKLGRCLDCTAGQDLE